MFYGLAGSCHLHHHYNTFEIEGICLIFDIEF